MIDSKKLKEIISFSKNLKVLYVEDDKNAQVQITKMFNNFFEDVTVCEDGQEGLKIFKENNFDLIISDIYMPNMNGIELLKNVREIDPEIPFIIISGHNETNFLLDAINFNVDAFLLKPVEIKQFTNLIFKTITRIKNEKDSIKLQEEQNKFAALGQMMDSIAHQWKQPLAILSMAPTSLEFSLETGLGVTEDEIKKCIDDMKTQIDHLVDTVDDFRSFFRPNELIRKVNLYKSINSVVNLMQNHIMKNYIKVHIQGEDEVIADLIETEIKHLFIILINNTIDAYNMNKIEDNRTITITLKKENDKNIIIFEDQAGGIPEDIIDKIFNLNFTTKEKGKGTGVGLYLVKQIVDKHDGTIIAKRIDNGISFIIEV